MVTELQNYDELAQQVLRDYLRSAVIIDDQWPEPELTEPALGMPDESELVADAIEDHNQDAATGEEFASDVMPYRPTENPKDARLLAELQRSLLREGLLACGFRYTHQTRQVAIDLARRADIVVLDWHLVPGGGEDALDILEKLRGNELRFVCIFTGHDRVSEVRHALVERLKPSNGDPETEEADLRIDNLVIAIRMKEGITKQVGEFTVGPSNLFTQALQGLARNYNGLVQLTMLDLTQLHRRQLPSILERIGKSIDAPVLLEAGDESSPIGQSGAFLRVLVDEWRAQLEQESITLRPLGSHGRQLFGKQLAKRLMKVSEGDLEKVISRTGVKAANAKALASQKVRSYLRAWLEKGCESSFSEVTGVNLKKGEDLPARWGILCAIPGVAEEEPAQPLLRLDALFHQQFETPKELTQGTVVSFRGPEAESPDYYICVTPACDAERPERLAHWFTFLRTKKVEPAELFNSGTNRRAAYCVIRDGERDLCLEALLKQRVVLCVKDRRFDSDKGIKGCLSLGEGDEKTAKPLQLVLVAQLRSEHSLAITAAAAADAARVGVNRVELVRSRFS